MHIVDDCDFGRFCKSLKPQYTLPSRGYVQDNVLEPMFQETQVVVKDLLSKCKNIGLTAEAWSSINHKSYITITEHTIDEAGDLHRYVLDTGEIKVRHTSENLLIHISKVLDKYNFKERNPALSTSISTMFEDNNPDDDGIDHLCNTQEESQEESQE